MHKFRCCIPLSSGLCVFFITGFLVSLSCQSPNPKQLSPAFYFWQTTYNPSPTERQLLDQLQIRKLYLRFFDVDWDPATQSAVPKTVVRFARKPVGLTIVPVVFITNQTLLRSDASAIPGLAENLFRKITQISRQNGLRSPEIQLDCDWSAGSRGAVFFPAPGTKKPLQGSGFGHHPATPDQVSGTNRTATRRPGHVDVLQYGRLEARRYPQLDL